jgi:hypothetical protein
LFENYFFFPADGKLYCKHSLFQKKIKNSTVTDKKRKKEIDDLFLSLAYISLSGNTLAFPFRASYLSFDNTIKQLSLPLSPPEKIIGKTLFKKIIYI